jgi:hypothetical protein
MIKERERRGLQGTGRRGCGGSENAPTRWIRTENDNCPESGTGSYGGQGKPEIIRQYAEQENDMPEKSNSLSEQG